MTNDDKLRAAFSTALSIPLEAVTDTLSYDGITEWDSVAHMALIAELENVFNVMLDTDDVIDLSSFAQSRNILRKYAVDI